MIREEKLEEGAEQAEMNAEERLLDLLLPPLPPPLRLSARWDPVTARLVFTAAHPDGLPVDPARAPRLSLRASTDLAQPRAAWTPVPVTWAPVGGVLQAELTPAPDAPARFFCVAEMP